MTARILVVDDIIANVKLLEARLNAEYFDVITATNGPDALDLASAHLPDIILLDVMMPGMDGFEVCRRIKADPRTLHIPIVMVTALDQVGDRVKGLEAGADDFLTKPVSDVALITRIKSLVRLKMLTDELRLRAETSRELGLEPAAFDPDAGGRRGRVLLVDDRRSTYERVQSMLLAGHEVKVVTNPQEALFVAADGDFELVMVSLALTNFDALRLCSQIRSLDRTRLLPILLIIDQDETARLLRALELGVNDYLVRPLDRQETLARVRTQIRRKRYTDFLRTNLQHTIEMAATDSLTGLYNRRYLMSHLGNFVDQSAERARPMAVLIVDIDFFKRVNDSHGHDAGDEVLREFSQRLRANVRGVDVIARLGGEEFVIAMPDTDLALAQGIAERLRQTVAGQPFSISGGRGLVDVTISIGIATFDRGDDTPGTLLKRADTALYRAKKDGRNRVVYDAA
ncbi:MAG: PleD family two-component system response regulator [Ancalomicrobiaceae bacterium]|nr:PleD family two-component system response regulator [Ancalomicrobiaceae bacterium]